MRVLAVRSLVALLICVVFEVGVNAQVHPLREVSSMESGLYQDTREKHLRSLSETLCSVHSNKLSKPNQIQMYSDSVYTAWTRYYASGLAPSYDEAEAIAVDDEGNVYVTGSSTSLPYGMDYCTVKYSPSGEQIWTVRYDGEGAGDAIAYALCLDSSGNVYVTGNLATVKYNSDGVQQWVVPGGGVTIAVDDSSNVYVARKDGRDFLTEKYEPDGSVAWSTYYYSNEKYMPRIYEVVVDGFGNVYIIGDVHEGGTRQDFVTVKYNAGGIQQWATQYTWLEDSHESPSAVAVDGAGNVYVTGYSEADYATVKYDSAGVEQWVARYDGTAGSTDGSKDILVDESHNVYVTGYSYGTDTGWDFVTIKYNSDGEELWVARYNSQENIHDCATVIAMDDSCIVYVAGWSRPSIMNFDYTTLKYNAEGILEWASTFDRPERPGQSDDAVAMAVDNAGNVFVTGVSMGLNTSEDYATVKYDSAGVEQWVACYNGPGRSSGGADFIDLDGSGNVYVTGYSRSANSDDDLAAIKYNPEGVEQWITRFGSAGNVNELTDMAVDGSGNMYVTGCTRTSYGVCNYVTVMLNSSGVEQWSAKYAGPMTLYDFAEALVVDGTGHVYVTGWSDRDCATVKYDSTGTELWVARYNGPGYDLDAARAIDVDGAGNVYVTGYSHGSGTGKDYTTIKYDPEGGEQWVARHDEGPGNDDEATDIAVDTEGNVYVTGYSNDWTDVNFIFTLKYHPDGSLAWVREYTGPRYSGPPTSSTVAVDGVGNVYVHVAGVLVKYNGAGVLQWTMPALGGDMTVDAAGTIYMNGRSADESALLIIDTNGITSHVIPFEGLEYARGSATDLALDAQGNVYVAGQSSGWKWSVFQTVKYDQPQYSGQLKGDINGDGVINILDVVYVVNHILSIQLLEGNALWRADTNGDVRIDVFDVLGIVNVILGLGNCGL